jgi:tetratricopeptide (TPR) repeat protein
MSIPSVKFSSSMRNKKKKSSVHPKEDSLPPRDMQLDAAQQPINRDSGGVMFLSAFPSTAASSINRHSRQYFTSSLPTLDETDSSDSENGSFDEVFNLSDADKNIAKPNRNADHVKDVATKNNTMLKVGTSSNSTSALRKATPLTGLERLQEYQRRGDDLAAIGQDAEAIVCYKKALKITRSETARIKSQLKQVDGKHPSTVQSIHSRLHEDWLAVGTSMTQIRLQMAVLQERVGDYANAIQSCQEASSVFQRQVAFLKRKKNDAAKLQETQRAAEHARTVLGRMRVAQDSFARRKTSHEEIVSLRMQPAIPDTSARLVQTIKAALAVEQKVLGLNHPQIADTMSLLSSVYQEQGDLKTALKLIRHASAINQGALGLKHPLAAEMVLQMARVLAQLGRDKEAVECYSQAISIFRESKKYPQFVGATLNEMGVVQIRFKNHIVAIASLQQALEAFQAREPLDGQTKLDIAQVYRNLGECYSALKQHKAAAESYVTTLEMQKESRAAYDAVAAGTDTSTPPVYLVDDDGIAETLRRLGKSYNMIGKRREALLALGEALLIHRNAMIKAVIPGRPSSTLPERQDQLAHTLFLIAEIREQLNEYEDALQFYEESMQLRLFSDAHRPEKRLNMVHCAMCLRGVGNIHMAKKEYEEAFKVFEDALRYCDAHGTMIGCVVVCVT